MMKHTFDSKKITKELLDQTMGDIFKQFFDIENYLNNSDTHVKEWIVIKLVTVIEQVCRKIISNQININNDMQLPESLLSMKFGNKTSIGDIITSQYNFQNTNSIDTMFHTYKIYDIFATIKKNDVDKLFDIRHNLVHSISKQQYDIKQLYATTQSLLKSIVSKSSYGLSYYDILHGDYFVNMDKLDKAMNCYNDAIRIDHTNILTYFCMGTIHYRKKNVKMVHDCSTKMIDFNSKAPYGYFLKGLAFELENEYKNAINYYNEAIKLQPDLTSAHYRKGYALLCLNRPIEALFCGYTVMALDPKNEEIVTSVVGVLNKINMRDESLDR